MEEKVYAVYMLTNYTKRVIYIGVTSDLERRIREHQTGIYPGFTKKYNVKYLVYYDLFGDVHLAIEREKELKGWKRSKKNDLITSFNPSWRDLSNTLFNQ